MTICFVYGIFNNVLKNFFYFNVDLADIYFHPAVPRFWYTIRCRYQGISLPMAGNFYNLAVNTPGDHRINYRSRASCRKFVVILNRPNTIGVADHGNMS